MNPILYSFMEAEDQGLVDALVNELKRSRNPHYSDDEEDHLRRRCERLVREFLSSIKDAPEHLSGYLCDIAGSRKSEGFQLREIQSCLSIFEQEVWKRCTQHVNEREDLLQVLSMVSWIIGHAKDELARKYLEQSEKAEAAMEDLKDRLFALFEAPESMAIHGDDF